MVRKDILTEKIDRIEGYLRRIKEFQRISEAEFLSDKSIQEAVLINLIWAIQACGDIASHIAADQNWRLPGSMGDLFDRLYDHHVVSSTTRETMRAMFGFRNVVVHDYAVLDLRRVYKIMHDHLDDFSSYLKEISTFAGL